MKGIKQKGAGGEPVISRFLGVACPILPSEPLDFINSATCEHYFSDFHKNRRVTEKLFHPSAEARQLENQCAELESCQDALALNSYAHTLFLLLEMAAAKGSSVLVVEPAPLELEALYTSLSLQDKLKMIRVEAGDHIGQKILDAVEQEDMIPSMIFMSCPAGAEAKITDIQQVADIAGILGDEKGRACVLAVENSSFGPWFQKPAELGAGLVFASLAEYIGGNDRIQGGVIAGRGESLELARALIEERRWHLPARIAQLSLDAMETGYLRKRGSATNAEHLASVLKIHPQVNKIFYPASVAEEAGHDELFRKQCSLSGARISLDLKTKSRAYKFLDNLKRVKLSPFMGKNRTVAFHARYHQPPVPRARGHLEGVVTIIAGVERVQEVVSDLTDALKTLELFQ